MLNRIRTSCVLAFALLGITAISALMGQTSSTSGPVMRFAATTVNVSGAPDAIRIDVLAWSDNGDRDRLLAAWNLTAPAAAAPRGAGRGGDGGAAGARGAAGGRGGDTPQAGAAPANPPDAGAAAAGGGRGGRGGGGAGGGGGRGGAAAADAVRPTPERALATALQGSRTVGYLWSSESAGYSLKYAYRVPQTDGSQRIIFVTDRRLGGWNDLWKPVGGAAVTDYDFTLFELRLNAKGDGEGKSTLSGKVTVDNAANTIALDGYAGLPVLLKDVKRRN